MDKKELRKQLKKKLDCLDSDICHQYSSAIAEGLYKESIWSESQTVAITISRSPEVDTWPIIRKGWEMGKRIAVPKCHPETRQMVFREITSFSQLETVYFGLLEPVETQTSIVKQEEIDLMIVPGLAYTVKGWRLGFGGGYYDRYLKHYQGRTLSLAFSAQIVNDLPIEDHDCPVDMIITEAAKYLGHGL